jgi:beta-lactamase class A
MAVWTTACVKSGEVATEVPVAGPERPEPAAKLPAERLDPALRSKLEEIISQSNAKIGVGARLLETGETVWIDPDGHFPSQSVYKLPIAMAVMKRIDEKMLRIDQQVIVDKSDFVRAGFHSPIRNENPNGTILPIGELVRASISESDGTASDVLLDLAGGPDAVQKYLAGIGVTDFIVADSEKSISKDWETQYRNWASPRASIELLTALQAGNILSEQSRIMLISAMTDSPNGRNRIRAGLPQGTQWAHKTGTGGTKDGVTGATNDIGIITLPDGSHLAIAIYVMDSRDDTPTRVRTMAEIASTIWEKWTGLPGGMTLASN